MCLPACYLRTKHVLEHAKFPGNLHIVCVWTARNLSRTDQPYINYKKKCCPILSYCACSCSWIADIKYCQRSSQSCWIQYVCGLHNTYLYIPCYGFRNFVLEIWELNSFSKGLHPAPHDSLSCNIQTLSLRSTQQAACRSTKSSAVVDRLRNTSGMCLDVRPYTIGSPKFQVTKFSSLVPHRTPSTGISLSQGLKQTHTRISCGIQMDHRNADMRWTVQVFVLCNMYCKPRTLRWPGPVTRTKEVSDIKIL